GDLGDSRLSIPGEQFEHVDRTVDGLHRAGGTLHALRRWFRCRFRRRLCCFLGVPHSATVTCKARGTCGRTAHPCEEEGSPPRQERKTSQFTAVLAPDVPDEGGEGA